MATTAATMGGRKDGEEGEELRQAALFFLGTILSTSFRPRRQRGGEERKGGCIVSLFIPPPSGLGKKEKKRYCEVDTGRRRRLEAERERERE